MQGQAFGFEEKSSSLRLRYFSSKTLHGLNTYPLRLKKKRKIRLQKLLIN